MSFNALPLGWTEHRSNGQPYWFNKSTGESSWQPPTGMILAPTTPTQPNQAKKIKKKIPGTPWLHITTADGLEFYYNKDTKNSEWEKPKEVEQALEKLKEQELEEQERERKRRLEEKELSEAKRQKSEDEAEEEPTELTEDDFALQLQDLDPEEMEELGLIPPEKEEESEKEEEEEESEKQEERAGGELERSDSQTVEKEKRQEDEETERTGSTKAEPIKRKTESAQAKEPELTHEECVERFTQMLSEKNISPFSTWEMELPKLLGDPRYTLLNPSKRKKLFNNYCRILAEERKAQRANEKTPEEEFTGLLEDLVNVKMYWEDFRRKAKDDRRFKAVFDPKERQRLFKDYVKRLQRGEIRTKEEAYIDLLRETKDIVPGVRWRDAKHILESDRRYQIIDSKTLREDLFRDYLDGL